MAFAARLPEGLDAWLDEAAAAEHQSKNAILITHCRSTGNAVNSPTGSCRPTRPPATPEPAEFGLVASTAARPSTTPFGLDPYPALAEKAAALPHHLAPVHRREQESRLLLDEVPSIAEGIESPTQATG
ncbi:hypothetical protein ABGB12_34135 [Actinocorallia sp. B10E7]|uniref:hypothetical protein n=1 Tax=Actinocorallia sp. B10E7 TaxID=3153558 RepID=UPI00325CAD5C